MMQATRFIMVTLVCGELSVSCAAKLTWDSRSGRLLTLATARFVGAVKILLAFGYLPYRFFALPYALRTRSGM